VTPFTDSAYSNFHSLANVRHQCGQQSVSI
jgi:hypothetical protein